jgi:hypothetical protein
MGAFFLALAQIFSACLRCFHASPRKKNCRFLEKPPSSNLPVLTIIQLIIGGLENRPNMSPITTFISSVFLIALLIALEFDLIL